MNQNREAAGLAPVSVDSLELLMDRLEKESYFQVCSFSSKTIISVSLIIVLNLIFLFLLLLTF